MEAAAYITKQNLSSVAPYVIISDGDDREGVSIKDAATKNHLVVFSSEIH